jgi:hypothetical protein
VSDDEGVREKFFELLKDPDWRVRDQAVQYFTTVRGDDEGVREKFFELLKDPDWRVRYRAVQYFTTIGSDDEGVRERIFELLKDPDGYVRDQAVQYFTTVGGDNEQVRERIVELLGDETYSVRLDKSMQEIAVDYLSRHAKQESFEKAHILFQSNNKLIKRGAYILMKSLLGVEY